MPYRTVGRVFGTPLVVIGWTWLPLFEGIVWALLTYIFHTRRPLRSLADNARSALAGMPLAVASEWGHNFAHAAAAQRVGRPMDYLRLTWGTPLVVYNQIDDPQVTPRQHVLRALGGPLFNLALLPAAWLLRRRTQPGSLARDAADTLLVTNLFLPVAGMLPLPALDGGPVLKWSLIARGASPEKAWMIVRKANAVGSAAAGAAGALALSKRRWGLAALLLQFAGLMAAYAFGWLRE